ncbi:Hpt domain-containing protein [Desulfovibrio oxyclinae]|uniref:Hpt domain-containing protein n=1 Tax=Desulfovibrio oxyclinae TaxID=63560 RepID=UPI000366E543|nr:Hpt domain-containing protein [Desulfovibrio oxyclinae]
MTFFDSEYFLGSLGGDSELAAELLDAYLEDSPKRRDTLAQAVETGDMDGAAKAAHSLKGMSGVVRATRLSEMALSIEMAAKEGREDYLREQFEQFDSSFADAIGEMRDFRGSI